MGRAYSWSHRPSVSWLDFCEENIFWFDRDEGLSVISPFLKMGKKSHDSEC